MVSPRKTCSLKNCIDNHITIGYSYFCRVVRYGYSLSNFYKWYDNLPFIENDTIQCRKPIQCLMYNSLRDNRVKYQVHNSVQVIPLRILITRICPNSRFYLLIFRPCFFKYKHTRALFTFNTSIASKRET